MPRVQGSKNKKLARDGKALGIRLTGKERALLDAAAGSLGKKTGDFIREVSLRAAKESEDGREGMH